MPKFQEWEYQYPDDAEKPVHIRMGGKQGGTMCGLNDVQAVVAEGPFNIRKTLDTDRQLCYECEMKFKTWLAARYPMLEGWV